MPEGGQRSAGFSLLELIVVVAIIGLLLALTIPAYQGYGERGRRLTAMMALHEIAARQERHYLEHLTYAATPEALGHPAHTLDRAYLLTIRGGDSRGFVAEARAAADGSQAGDEECALFSLDAVGRRQARNREDVERSEACWR